MRRHAPSLAQIVADPRWFPVDLDTGNARVAFARLDRRTVETENFLDSRLPIDWASAIVVDAAALAEVPVVASGAPVAWLWHTSFCGSTLLARMLQLAPWSVALREPLALRRLADARDASADVTPLVAPLAALLARAWDPGGRVVVKPTHAALNIAADAMAADSRALGIFLTSRLDDFITSHFKKTPETLHSVEALAQRALRATPAFAARLGDAARSPPDVLCQAALQWAAQREVMSDLLAGAHGARLRVVDFDALLADPRGVARDASAWLGLDAIPVDALASHAAAVAGRHAKAPGRAYGADVRHIESRRLLDHYRDDLARTLRWAERVLLPSMRPAALEPAGLHTAPLRHAGGSP